VRVRLQRQSLYRRPCVTTGFLGCCELMLGPMARGGGHRNGNFASGIALACFLPVGVGDGVERVDNCFCMTTIWSVRFLVLASVLVVSTFFGFRGACEQLRANYMF